MENSWLHFRLSCLYSKLNQVYFQCYNGWYGTDCSIPSVVSPMGEWPKWFRPAQIDIPSNGFTGSLVNLNAAVKKKRPLIYVYDLPPEFNSLLLEVRMSNILHLILSRAKFLYSLNWPLQGRHFKFQCVNRIYDDRNATLWTDQLYGSQVLFKLVLMQSTL